ncbi:hypothetical protein J3Q64DRAFT_1639316 [Phycomyces blakesleeanus]|uniref:Uncharacterized protein n=1 Tax=Phycomyces blakesleeanus TaxID=4837 RepID=A0ABR3B024_PHYBL
MISQHTNQPTLLTLHDAITDSPVYRTNVHHYDEQLDHLEKWLDSLSRHLKLYTEKINSNAKRKTFEMKPRLLKENEMK